MMRVILASGSPRRKELLHTIYQDFEILPAKGEEISAARKPEDRVRELACHKAREIYGKETGPVLVIGADTIVVADGCVLGKPKDRDDAHRMLTLLQGNDHSVMTGVCLLWRREDGSTGEDVFFSGTKVSVYPMTGQEVEDYIATGEPMDKAGAYGIQGTFRKYVKGIEGSYNNVVGLPVSRLYHELTRLQLIQAPPGIPGETGEH